MTSISSLNTHWQLVFIKNVIDCSEILVLSASTQMEKSILTIVEFNESFKLIIETKALLYKITQTFT
jgi:hypothetical protein